MTSVADELEQRATRRAADSTAAYLAAVGRAGRGEELTADELERVLGAAGRTPGQFRADVSGMARRIEQAARIADEKPAEERRAAALAKIGENNKRIEEFAAPIRNENALLAWQADREMERMQAANDARREMIRTAPDSLTRRLAAIDEQVADKEVAIRRAHNEMTLTRNRADAGPEDGFGVSAARVEEQREARRLLPRLVERWQLLKDGREALLAERAKVEQRMFQP